MFRHRWRSWLLLSLLIALVSGLVLAGAATGRRTASAFPRFKAAYGYDAFLLTLAPAPKLAASPEVASATPVGAVGTGPPTCACSRPMNWSDVGVFEVAPRDLPSVVKLVAGRMPDQSDPHQVLASFSLQQDAGVHIGTVIHVPLYAASQRTALLSGADVKPGGPTVALRVVGIEAADGEFPGTGPPDHNVYITQAFARTVNRQTVILAGYLVRLRHGAADLPRFQARARALGAVALLDLDAQTGAVVSSIRPQAVGWWILASLAALAGITVVAQALARQAVIESEPYATLSALGVSRRQLAALTMTTTLMIATAGAAGGVALAFALSPLTPVGEARIADPSQGFAFDAPILLPGAAAAVIVVLALGLWPAARAVRGRPPAQPALARPSRIVALLTGAMVPASLLIGVRHALERDRDRAAVPVGSALLGSVLAVTALCATAVFGASLSHLTSTPALYGQPFDLTLSPGQATQFSQLVTALTGDRAISDISLGVGEDVSINGRTVSGIAGQSLRGQLLLTKTSGRLPDADDQIALGATTLRQIGAHIGSLVRVTAPSARGRARTSTDRVVGTTVFAPNVGTAGLGTGAAFTLSGLLGDHCAPGRAGTVCQVRAVTKAGGVILVRAAPGPGREAALARLSRTYPDDVQFPATPANLANFGQAVNFPLIFGLVLVLFGVATLMHLLLVSVARRRPELGLLKALGFVRRQVAFSVLWQATTVALAGIIIGVPAGVAAGRLIWLSFAASLGVVPAPVVIAWAIAAIALGTVLAANALAIGPSLTAARSHPASLRAE
jgi:ABC-type lipoprotein release transport system permease subunit